MYQPKEVSEAVLCALSAGAISQGAIAQHAIEEVVVTPTKRSASMQGVPIAVQAMGAQQLKEQNIQLRRDVL